MQGQYIAGCGSLAEPQQPSCGAIMTANAQVLSAAFRSQVGQTASSQRTITLQVGFGTLSQVACAFSAELHTEYCIQAVQDTFYAKLFILSAEPLGFIPCLAPRLPFRKGMNKPLGT